jgi:hypothetical protein
MAEKGNIFDKIEKIDRRFMYGLMVIVILWPLISPIGLPIPINYWTKMAYDAIEAIPPGTKVLFCPDMITAAIGELGPMSVVFAKHLFAKGAKVYILTLDADTSTNVDAYLMPRITSFTQNKKYGEDYVYLGLLLGGEASEAAFAKNPQGVFKVDFYGKELSKMPIWQGIESAFNFDMVVFVGMAEEVIRQFQGPYKLPVVMGAFGMMGPLYMPYLASGQLTGMLYGLSGSAEYEKLTGFSGDGLTSSDANSMAHLLIFILLVVGNGGFLLRKLTKGGKAKER